ncbi:MAG: hypothetical protein ACI828_001372 [Flavobacteriales bacterium]|jgi:hypothetical protein
MMRKLLLLILVCAFFMSCSSESSTDDTADIEESPNDTNDDSGTDSSEEMVLPEIAILGYENFSASPLYFINWDENYENKTTLNLYEQLNTDRLSYFSDTKGFFYVTDFDFSNSKTYRYSFLSNTFQEYISTDYLVSQAQSPFQRIRPTGDYILSEIKDNSTFDSYFNAYNVNSESTYEYYLGEGQVLGNGSYIKGRDDFAFLIFDPNDNDNYELHIFNLRDETHFEISYEFSTGLMYHGPDETLFVSDGDGCLADYKVLDLSTFQIEGTGTFGELQCSNSFIPDSKFFNDQILFNLGSQGDVTGYSMPTIYNSTTLDRRFFLYPEIRDSINNSTPIIGFVHAINLDLELEIIIAGYEYRDTDNITKGGVAFLNYDLEVLKVIPLNEIIPDQILFK